LDTTQPKSSISPFASRTLHSKPVVLTKNQNPDQKEPHRLQPAYEVRRWWGWIA